MRPSPATLVLIFALQLALSAGLRAQGLDEVKAHYTKYEYRIPMRDGVKLFTSVYVPKETTARYPILLKRTPYSVRPYGVDQYPNDLGPSAKFGKEGFIFAYQDVRGRWMSEGTFVNMRPEKDGSKVDESTDTYDTIEWLLKHVDGHNQKVGMYGTSYAGFYAAAGLIDSHPALKAVSPQAPIMDWFLGDDWHHNGALMLAHCFNFMSGFDHPRPEPTKKFSFTFDYGTPDGYDFYLRMGTLSNADRLHFRGEAKFWNEIQDHPVYDDWWKARNIRPHLKDVKPAVMTVGGWFDAENLFGAIECYRAIETSTPGAHNVLVMGPWSHGHWNRGEGSSLGSIAFNAKTAEFYREHIEFPFFDAILKGKEPLKDVPEAYVFETGTNRWRKYDTWPPKGGTRKTFYLGAEGTLSSKQPDKSSETAFDEYVGDPAHPVPFVEEIAHRMVANYMLADQRFASRRTDVLTYRTPILEEDMTFSGPVKVNLHVATTGTDADFVVKLIDVYPDDYPDQLGAKMGGYQQLIRGDVMRGRFRKSFETPEPFKPGEPAEVAFTMPDINHSFREGHRIMIQVQSSWFPLVDRNPQTFVDIYKAKPEDFKTATHRVFRSEDRASRIEVLVGP